MLFRHRNLRSNHAKQRQTAYPTQTEKKPSAQQQKLNFNAQTLSRVQTGHQLQIGTSVCNINEQTKLKALQENR